MEKPSQAPVPGSGPRPRQQGGAVWPAVQGGTRGPLPADARRWERCRGSHGPGDLGTWACQLARQDPGAMGTYATGAWILTSALRVGLARYVGQAVRDHSLASTSARARVVAIGLASLGRVLHRQLLDNAQVSVCLGAPQPLGKVDLRGKEGPRAPKYPPGWEGGLPRKPPMQSQRLTAVPHLPPCPPASIS